MSKMPKRPKVVNLVLEYFKNLGCRVTIRQTMDRTTFEYNNRPSELKSYDEKGLPIVRVNLRSMLGPLKAWPLVVYIELYFGDALYMFTVRSSQIDYLQPHFYLYLIRKKVQGLMINLNDLVLTMNYIFMHYDENSKSDIEFLMDANIGDVGGAAKIIMKSYQECIDKNSPQAPSCVEALAVLMELNNELCFVDTDEAANYIL